MQDIFLFVQDGIDENGRAFGHFESTGVRPAFMDRLESAGVRLPGNLFAAPLGIEMLEDDALESDVSLTGSN